jgi:hypothetical protein
VATNAREQFNKYQKVHQLIAEKKLFGVPLPQTQGPDYEKPKEYLSIAWHCPIFPSTRFKAGLEGSMNVSALGTPI